MICVFGKYVLDNIEWEKMGVDFVMLDLIKWYGVEEIEYCIVVFDLYRYLGGGYIVCYYLSLVVIVVVLGLWVDGVVYIMK